MFPFLSPSLPRIRYNSQAMLPKVRLPLRIGLTPLRHQEIKPSSRIIKRHTVSSRTPGAAQSYASVYILAEAIADAQSTDPVKIRDVLANTMDLDTVLGKFSFDAVGDAVYDPIVLIVKNSQLQIFE